MILHCPFYKKIFQAQQAKQQAEMIILPVRLKVMMHRKSLRYNDKADLGEQTEV